MFLLSNSQAISESFGKQLHIIAFNMLEQLDMIEKAFDFMLSRTARMHVFRMMDMHFPMNEDLSEGTDQHFFLMFDVFTLYYHNTN